MKLHASVIEKLLQIYTNYGGFSNDTRLRKALNEIDLTVYERKTTALQEMVLVDSSDYSKKLSVKE